MFKKSLLLSVGIVCLIAAVPAGAADRTWDGGAGTTNWLTAQNWSADTTPATGDNGILNTTGVTLTGTAPALAQVRLGNANGNAASLAISGAGQLTSTHGNIGWIGGSTGTVTLSGAGASWGVSTDFRVGDTGAGEITVSNGASLNTSTSSNTYLGVNSGSSGIVTVTGTGSTWTANTSLLVGYGSTGTVNVLNGGRLTKTSGTISLGSNTAGSNGTVTVDGAGSTMSVQSELVVGNNGTGNLNISNGGTVTSALGRLGGVSTGNGIVNVSGTGSTWTASNSFLLASAANSQATFNVSAGGVASNTAGNSTIGNGTGSTAVATITGAGSQWNHAATLRIGGSGTGTLNIENGGVVTNVQGTIGLLAGSNGTVKVDGAGSLWTNSSTLRIGDSGTGLLNIQNGGTVTSLVGMVMGSAAGVTGTMNVTGPGSSYTFSGTSTTNIGSAGIGIVNVTNGGTFTYANGSNHYLGFDPGSSGTMTIDGAGSKVTSNKATRIGNSGTGVINVQNGGYFRTDGFNMANNADGTGTLTITGAGSFVDATSTNSANVGSNGTATLNILNGGRLNTLRGSIGVSATASGSALIDGAGSIWAANGNFLVGDDGSATLRVQNGGRLDTTGTNYIGYSAGNGTATVTGTGSQWSTLGDIVIGRGTGTLVVENNASVLTDTNTYVGYSLQGTLTVQSGGVLTSQYGSIGHSVGVNGNATVTGTGSAWNISGMLYAGRGGTGTLDILNGGVVRSTALVESTYPDLIGVAGVVGSYSGGTGNVKVDGNGSAWVTNGILRFGGGEGGNTGHAVVTLSNAGKIIGTEVVIGKSGASTGVLNIGAAAADPAAAPGTLVTPTVRFGTGTGTINFKHTSTNYIFSPDLIGAGTINFLAGRTLLTGNLSNFAGTINGSADVVFTNGSTGVIATNSSAFNGTTTVNNDSTLIVNGSLGGTTIVEDGLLKGNGTLNTLTFNNGGVAAPGNSIGTINAVNVNFGPGSVYEVELNSAGQSDLIHATGTATLTGGTVRVVPFPDFRFAQPYTILTADVARVGAFDGADSNSFLTGTLSYDPNNVYLTLAPNAAGLVAAAQTDNQRAVATRIVPLAGLNAAVNAVFALGQLTVQNGLDLLSGEVHASMATAQIRDQSLLRRAVQAHRPEVNEIGMRYWAEGFGSSFKIDQTFNTGSADGRTAGVLLGGQRSSEQGYIGGAIGQSLTDIDMDSRASKGESHNSHIIAYGGMERANGLAIDGGASFTWNKVDTKRSIILPAFAEVNEDSYNAQVIQVFARLQKLFPVGALAIGPYLEGAYVYYNADDIDESGVAGLQGDSSNHVGFTTLGFSLKHKKQLDAQKSINVKGGIGWRHALGNVDPSADLALKDFSANGWNVEGAPIEPNAIVLNTEIGLGIANDVHFSLGYDGLLAPDTRVHALTGRATIKF